MRGERWEKERERRKTRQGEEKDERGGEVSERRKMGEGER